jgi:hypothetical protein
MDLQKKPTNVCMVGILHWYQLQMKLISLKTRPSPFKVLTEKPNSALMKILDIPPKERRFLN